MVNVIAKVGSNGAKYLGKAVHADNTKILSKVAEAKGVLKEATARPLISKELQNFDFMLRKGLKINNIEIPADTFLAQVPKMQRKAIANLLGNPDKVVCTAKANTKGSGFSILGFIGKKGEKTVGKGAVSVSNIGSHDAVAKWRFNGKNLQTNGYVDCAQTATPEQVSIIPEFAKKMFGVKTQVGKAAGINLNVNAKKAIDIIPDQQFGEFAHKQTSGVTQSEIDKLMKFAKNILS